MRNYTKANIRLERVGRRQPKISYKGLKPQEYKLIKLLEQDELFDKAKSYFWSSVVRDENGCATAEGNNWELFEVIDKLHRPVIKKIDGLLTKWKWKEADIFHIKATHKENNIHSQLY